MLDHYKTINYAKLIDNIQKKMFNLVDFVHNTDILTLTSNYNN